MNVDTHSQGSPLTSALADHAKRRLRFVTTRYSDRIQRVVVRLGDENGSRGGIDKFCRIQVHLLDAPVAAIDNVGADLYAVIDRATDRVGRVVVKHLDRSRIDRRPGRADTHLFAPVERAQTPHPAHPEGERA